MIQGFGLALRDEEGNWTWSAVDTMVNDAAFPEAMSFTFLLILVIVPDPVRPRVRHGPAR